MFNRIWKEQISQQKGKATIFQPKEKMKPDRKEDCNRRLKEYAEELQVNTQIYQGDTHTTMKGIYNPVPEDLACQALKTLDNIHNTGFGKAGYWFPNKDGPNYYVSCLHLGIGNVFKMFLLITQSGAMRSEGILLFRTIKKTGSPVSPEEIEKYMEMVDWR